MILNIGIIKSISLVNAIIASKVMIIVMIIVGVAIVAISYKAINTFHLA